MSEERPTCRSCKAPIMWLKNETTGKMAPVDVVPTFGGNVVANRTTGTYRVVKPDRSPRFRLHFMTCPDAVAHRKAKPKRGELPFTLPL